MSSTRTALDIRFDGPMAQRHNTSEQYAKRLGPPSNQDHPTRPILPTIYEPCHSEMKVLDVEAGLAKALAREDQNARPRHFCTNFEEWIFVFTIMMSTAATTFLQGVIIINTATIGKDLDMNAAEVTWISAAIGLASGSFMLVSGKTADMFGRKIQLVGGMALLALFSLITVFVPNPIAMDTLCGFLGFGTAIIAPPAIGALFATYPEGRRRNRVAGVLGAGAPVGFILGSISSGIATKYFSWRVSFSVVALFFLIMTVLALWTVPSAPLRELSRLDVKQFDYLGTILTILGVSLFSAGLTQGPESGWKSPSVIVTLILGTICLLGFGLWETLCAYPLLNPVVWRNRTYTLCVLCSMFGYMSFITNQFWITLHMQQIQHLEPLNIAARLLPQAFAGIFWSYVCEYLTNKLNGTIIMGIGGLGDLIGAILLLFVREDSSYWQYLFPALIITVVGADFQFIISNLYITRQMPKHESLAAGVLQMATRLSIAIGLAITAAVYGSVNKIQEVAKDSNLPYFRAHLCTILFAAIGLVFIPFMSIETQPITQLEDLILSKESPEHGKISTEAKDVNNTSVGSSARHTRTLTSLGSKTSESSFWSGITTGTENSYFPRWSWEDDHWVGSSGERYKGAEVLYEVCVKCLEERAVIVGKSNGPRTDLNDGVNGVWNSSERRKQNPDQYQEWKDGKWKNEWDPHWYAERGVRDNASGWV